MRIFLIPLFAGLLCAQATERVTVISAGGGWLWQGHLLARGTPLDQKATVTGNAAAGELIVECPNLGWISYSCKRKDGSCDVSMCAVNVPDVNSQRMGEWYNPRRLTTALFQREPKEGVTLGVRSGGNPADAVLLQNAQGVHWGPALNRVIEGRYCLRLNPLPAPARPASQVFPLEWDRDTDPEGFGQASSLAPGLYTLNKGKPGAGGGCNVDPDETAAWVLIAVEPQFAQLNAQWKEKATDLAQLERAGTPPSVMANLRHAVLAALADGAASR
jgi:hypothetical protein